MTAPTCRKITLALYWSMRSTSQLLIPRYTPAKWWECDMWRLTKADFVDEYEIKMSVADFRADAKKVEKGWEIDETGHYRQKPTIAKHDLLAGSERGPNRFWFVVTEDIADKIKVPDYAGLLIAGRQMTTIVKQAPKRHARKWDGDKLRLFQTFYHRYWTHEAGADGEFPSCSEPIAGLDDEFLPRAANLPEK